MAKLRLFAQAREAAARGSDVIEAGTVDEVLAEARRRYGKTFADVLAYSAVWLNGSPAEGGEPVAAGDEIAVLPPVSGGA